MTVEETTINIVFAQFVNICSCRYKRWWRLPGCTPDNFLVIHTLNAYFTVTLSYNATSSWYYQILISRDRTSISSDLTYPVIFPTTQIWLPVRFGYQHGILACKILTITGRHFHWPHILSNIVYESNIATSEILLLKRYGYLQDTHACNILAIAKCQFLAVSPI